MKRIFLILALGLVSLPFYAQECPELDCISGLTATITEDAAGDCSVILLATGFISNNLSNCPSPLSFAVYR